MDVRQSLLLYAITDRSWLGGRTLKEQVREALQGGVTMIQLREKDMPYEDRLREAAEILDVCREFGVPLIINDDVELAMQVGADGVHLGQKDMDPEEARRIMGPDKIIGASARTIELAKKAQEKGADYLGVGAVFHTGSKRDAVEVGPQVLREICAAVEIPIVAIGGIDSDNVSELSGSGIAGIAVISAVFGADDVRQAAANLKQKIQKIQNK